jgi:hypothetical protein
MIPDTTVTEVIKTGIRAIIIPTGKMKISEIVGGRTVNSEMITTIKILTRDLKIVGALMTVAETLIEVIRTGGKAIVVITGTLAMATGLIIRTMARSMAQIQEIKATVTGGIEPQTK